MARGEEHRATRIELEFAHLGDAPLVIRPATDDKLHQILAPQALELRVTIAPGLPGRGRLDIDDPDHALIHIIKTHRAARLKRHSIACGTQFFQQLQAVLLSERLAARHADVPRAELPHARENVRQLPPFTPVESVGRVAVLTAQRTARQADKRSRNPRGIGLTLQRIEDLGDLQARHRATYLYWGAASADGRRLMRS
jgi:hypothetical protein